LKFLFTFNNFDSGNFHLVLKFKQNKLECPQAYYTGRRKFSNLRECSYQPRTWNFFRSSCTVFKSFRFPRYQQRLSASFRDSRDSHSTWDMRWL